MKGAAKKADYGEMRSYFYDKKQISSAVHKGLDLASFAHAKIYVSNNGKVIYNGFNGIYGKLGIQPVFAAVYNARAKVIERFFLEFEGQVFSHKHFY